MHQAVCLKNREPSVAVNAYISARHLVNASVIENVIAFPLPYKFHASGLIRQ